MGRRYETVSFLSDYGTEDEFVGVVHSVIRSIAPHAAIVDVTTAYRPSTSGRAPSLWPEAPSTSVVGWFSPSSIPGWPPTGGQ